MRVFTSFDDFAAHKGEHLGFGEWHVVDQDRIDRFADATGDHQWIHVDPERAKEGPFGTTIAHGYLTLSMIPVLGKDIFRLEGPKMMVNYGTDKVRFPSPVPVGSRVRVGAELLDVREVAQGRQITIKYTVEVEGQPKPACVAESLVLVVL
ncbi:MaoC family dehydratase [Yinghuangia seranimata]|uniref:MaoC family dehydratase n=1 Tax=Yinghuangia seranimata TaxID=408067 RepID=UPI00248D35A3|nr:MaoC family dehydratase [Yinghuangia seranimata]MDI2129770.1 MaoC family dehydratase [Yinghuangia seranimata]